MPRAFNEEFFSLNDRDVFGKKEITSTLEGKFDNFNVWCGNKMGSPQWLQGLGQEKEGKGR